MKNRFLVLTLIMIMIITPLQAGIRGAAAGAGIGAAVGHIIGGNDEAWIGAALGAAGGAMIEESNRSHEKDIEASNAVLHGYNSQQLTAAPKAAEKPVPVAADKKTDTWGIRSEEDVRERMAKEEENHKTWMDGF